jgi:large subunit ribosomal protein L5
LIEQVEAMARLQQHYRDNVVKQLMEQFAYKNVMEVPKITKITLNMGVGEAVGDKKIIENAVGDMEKIAGQKVVVTLARKANAGFKIREGWPIGCKVTLAPGADVRVPGSADQHRHPAYSRLPRPER